MDQCDEVAALYRTRYAGFTARHFHEHLVRDHRFPVLELQLDQGVFAKRGLLAKSARRGAHRCKRPRRPLPRMMLHQDGSRHAWLAAGPALDLIAMLDNATNEVYALILVEEEGTAST